LNALSHLSKASKIGWREHYCWQSDNVDFL